MGPFCPEQGTSSHKTMMDLASINEKVMFLGEEVGSEKETLKWSYKIHITPGQGYRVANSKKSLAVVTMINIVLLLLFK